MSDRKTSTTVAVRPETQVPAPLFENFAADAGDGLENATAEDFAIPFLSLLQKMSPQVDEDNDAYREEARPGMIMNSVTGELFTEGVDVIPVKFIKVFNEFVPRASGGGFRGSYLTREEAHANVESGNEIIDTNNHYVLHRTANGSWQPALISCTSTKLKTSRHWNAKMRQVTLTDEKTGKVFVPPTYAMIYHLGSVGQENAKGKFHNFSTEFEGFVTMPERYATAKAFKASVDEGLGRVDYDAIKDGKSATSDDKDGDEQF